MKSPSTGNGRFLVRYDPDFSLFSILADTELPIGQSDSNLASKEVKISGRFERTTTRFAEMLAKPMLRKFSKAVQVLQVIASLARSEPVVVEKSHGCTMSPSCMCMHSLCTQPRAATRGASSMQVQCMLAHSFAR